MARHLRRLTFWLLAGIAALVVLALLALAALWWWFDPNDYRAQIESRTSSAIGRQVRLTGALSWQLGRQISLVSAGGEIANAAAFGADPLARWSRMRLGVAARPLLRKQVEIDRIEVDGLQLDLQRNAAGAVNWELVSAGENSKSAAQAVTLRIGEIRVQAGALRYRDAATGADWRVSALNASAGLPDDLLARELALREVKLDGRIAGAQLAGAGVAFSVQAPALQWSPAALHVRAFTARWQETELQGAIDAEPAPLAVSADFSLRSPSLRALLNTAGIVPPEMRDSTTLGKLQLKVALRYTAGAATLHDLSVTLDDTHLTGEVSLPAVSPLALRFNLAADRIDLDRYREPADVKGKPLELPLAWLKQLDAKGTLRIRQATIAGAAAKEVIIDVE